MLKEIERPDGDRLQFEYDAIGRRISKTHEGRKTRWLWDGDNLLHEWVSDLYFEDCQDHGDQSIDVSPCVKQEQKKPSYNNNERLSENVSTKLITWLFKPESFTPIAKVKSEEAYSIVTDQTGVPISMFDRNGHCKWQATVDIYGRLENIGGEITDCPFRFPGQYHDTETELYYNRFRYYDPRTGLYLSPDPLGISGGLRLYGYVTDPISWIDPFGLFDVAAWIETPSGQRVNDLGVFSNESGSGAANIPDRNGWGRAGDAENQVMRRVGRNPALRQQLRGNVLVILALNTPIENAPPIHDGLMPCRMCHRGINKFLRDMMSRFGINATARYHGQSRRTYPCS